MSPFVGRSSVSKLMKAPWDRKRGGRRVAIYRRLVAVDGMSNTTLSRVQGSGATHNPDLRTNLPYKFPLIMDFWTFETQVPTQHPTHAPDVLLTNRIR